jgi:ATP-dependent DNA helicase DinG
METIFGPSGLLAGALPDYEVRPGQAEMALAIAQTLDGRDASILAVEAETGIGKTLAYLIPAVRSGQKVVISTGTLNLQDQILNQEIPFIRRHIDPGLTALCVKGRQNYLCVYRYRQLVVDQQQRLFAIEEAGDRLRTWLENTESGDRTELEWLPDDSPLWRQISATAAQCLGMHCPDEQLCFINRLRKKAAAARLLIVNHHLFFSDLAVRRSGYGEVLPRYESVIFDEAHHLEAIATTYFGTTFSHYQVFDLANDIKQAAANNLGKTAGNKLALAADMLVEQTEHFAGLFPDLKGKFPLADFIGATLQWEQEVQDLADRFQRLLGLLQDHARSGDILSGILTRGEELLANLHTVIGAVHAGEEETEGGAIQWYDRRARSVSLTVSPIEIGGVLQECLYSKTRSCIFTSATLTAGGKFTYFLERLGLPADTATLCLPSPFDYEGRTLLYIPANAQGDPFPQPGTENFLEKIEQRIYDILLVSRGRGLVLFTSINAMQRVHRFLSDRLPYPVLLQGEAPRSILLASFREQSESVLLAVASFWEGVNIPGESLSCVIIDKLPFEVPNDPITMARLNKIKQQGGNPFFDFQIPRAILALRQGLGRLMRAATDRGLLAILDIRLFSKSYGQIFRNSLPPSPVTRSFTDVKHFFTIEP